MKRFTLIRFVGEPERNCYFLKLGSQDNPAPYEREFLGGEEINVWLTSTPNVSECVDLMFQDGEYALEVPANFFVILDEFENH